MAARYPTGEGEGGRGRGRGGGGEGEGERGERGREGAREGAREGEREGEGKGEREKLTNLGVTISLRCQRVGCERLCRYPSRRTERSSGERVKDPNSLPPWRSLPLSFNQ